MPPGTNAVNGRRYQSAGELSTICTDGGRDEDGDGGGGGGEGALAICRKQFIFAGRLQGLKRTMPRGTVTCQRRQATSPSTLTCHPKRNSFVIQATFPFPVNAVTPPCSRWPANASRKLPNTASNLHLFAD